MWIVQIRVSAIVFMIRSKDKNIWFNQYVRLINIAAQKWMQEIYKAGADSKALVLLLPQTKMTKMFWDRITKKMESYAEKV